MSLANIPELLLIFYKFESTESLDVVSDCMNIILDLYSKECPEGCNETYLECIFRPKSWFEKPKFYENSIMVYHMLARLLSKPDYAFIRVRLEKSCKLCDFPRLTQDALMVCKSLDLQDDP